MDRARKSTPTVRGLASCVAASAALLGACGELSTNVEEPTHLVTVRTTAAAHDVGDRKLRLSLVWRTTDKSYFAPQDDVAVADTKVPIDFDVRRPPPEAALHAPVLVPAEGTPMRFAQGGFVLYTDGNGNGTLDFTRGRAEATAGDTIVSANPDVVVVWLERSPSESETSILADARGTVPLAGLNFLRASAEGLSWVRSSEPVDLGLPSRIEWPDRLCSYLFESPIPSFGPTLFDLDRTYPPVGSQGLTCTEGGQSLSLAGCAAVGLCFRSTVCTTITRRIAGGVATPEGWPCPVQ